MTIAQHRENALTYVEHDEVYETTAQHRLKILLVEDDYGDAILTTLALCSSGLSYDLTRLSDGSEVGDLVSAASPDVIILDLSLPGQDGLEVLDLLKDVPGINNRLIVTTGLQNLEEYVDIHALPVTHILPKPVTPESLRRVLMQLPHIGERMQPADREN